MSKWSVTKYTKGTCRSGKLRYPTELLAETALVRTIYVGVIRGKHKRAENRVYHCPLCKGWHLTSAPKLEGVS